MNAHLAIAIFMLTQPVDVVQPKHVRSPADTVAIVASDIAKIPEHDRIFYRYVAFPSWIDPIEEFEDPAKREVAVAWRSARATAATVNMTSRASIIVLPGISNTAVARYDLRELVDEIEDFPKFAAIWDRLSLFDARYYAKVELLVGLNEIYKEGDVFFDCPRCGKRYRSNKLGSETHCERCGTHYRIPGKDVVHVKTGRQLAPHLGTEQIGGLVQLMGVATPIVTADVLVAHGLTTIDGLGFYYDLTGLKGLNLEDTLKTLGADQKFAEQELAARFAAMNHSGVTGKPRALQVFQGTFGYVLITFDFADNADTFDIRRNPFYNALAFDFDAGEAIWERANGWHGFGLYDGQGEQADEAPETIAVAHNRPGPRSLPRGGGFGTKRLQPGLDCFICHNAGVFSGMQPVVNDLGDPQGFDITDDLSQKFDFDAIRILASRYHGNIDRQLRLIRDTYSLAIHRTVKEYGAASVENVAALVADDVELLFNSYHDLVDCRQAMVEIGYGFDNNLDAVNWLRSKVPYFRSGVGRLLDGQAIPRNDWNRELAETAYSILESDGTVENHQPQGE